MGFIDSVKVFSELSRFIMSALLPMMTEKAGIAAPCPIAKMHEMTMRTYANLVGPRSSTKGEQTLCFQKRERFC